MSQKQNRKHNKCGDDYVQDPEKPRSKKEPEWKKYEKMSLEDKRKFYKCGDNYVQIKDIETWSKFYQDNGYYFSKIQKSHKTEKPAYHVNVKINDKISLWEGDITRLEIDAIVNAANRSLLGGGGVDGCIHRAAGDTLVQECRLRNGCDTGDAKITSGHKLPARHVIHTVGPIGKHEKDLKSCYKTCLKLALENEVRTLAFCCISTGIYGYPNRDAAEVALNTTREWLEVESNANAIDRIIFCLFLDKDIKIYQSLMLKYFPPEELKRPAKKPAEEMTKEQAKSEKDKATEIKEPGEKEQKDDAKKRDENMGTESEKVVESEENVDTNKEDEEMETERKEEKIKPKVTDALVLAGDDDNSSKAEEKKHKEKPDPDEEMKKVEESQNDENSSKAEEKKHEEKPDPDEEMKKVEESQNDENSLKAEEKKHEEKPDPDEEMKKVEELQKGRKAEDNENGNAEIPINPSKKQKQEDLSNNSETKDQADMEMTEEKGQDKQQNTEDKKQGEKMNVEEDLPKQQTDAKDEQMSKETMV